ncbi:MAG: homocysteine S-methyltransferase family protein [Oscillospiraceae bacterium]|jgi:5-methyltetrahydrofolate--homocysteine methyltransferase|nr:homocysteine S-methyltransferase family protein [Oscillospiraceae bacterium]
MDLSRALNESVLLFDGGMGMLLTERGLKPGQAPYRLNTERPDIVLGAHKEYVAAGADAVSSNTFTAETSEDVAAGVRLAKQAGARCTAFSIGPTGRLIEPMGSMTFEEAYGHYAALMAAAEQNGADLVLIETMSDLYECKAAILAARETTSLPVFCTVTVQGNGRTLTGAPLTAAAAALKSMGVAALGVNCSLGPAQLKPLLNELLQATDLPVMIQPNAGLPRLAPDGSAVYDVSPQVFAEYAEGFVRAGARIVGGCCGTTPAHIAEMRRALDRLAIQPKEPRQISCPVAVSGTRAVNAADGFIIIGERLNPTGKKRLQAALRAGDMSVIRQEALRQQEAGCHILDVNAGLPELDEPSALREMVKAVQSVSNLPVQIDSSDPAAIEAALRVVNGKAVINSVSGKKESLNAILPLAKKYGASVICLALDEKGIPETAEGRLAVVRTIKNAANEAGIPDSDLMADCLTLTVAAQPEQAMETLKAVRMVREELGLATVLGVSNISYGMPEREKLGSAFLLAALSAGLSAAIMNPLSEPFSDALRNWRLLTGKAGEEEGVAAAEDKPLHWYIEQYDAGTVFLPELLRAAKREIEALRAKGTSVKLDLPPILMASVQGDIHDIGKNIVITMLECHGFPVVDLGKDVPPEAVVAAVGAHKARLVGLSALMTTTVRSMKDTVKLVKAAYPACAVMIGGAAVSAEVSDAAFYGRDALEAVSIAKRVMGAAPPIP